MTPVIFGPDDPLNGMVGDFVSNIVWGEPGRLEKYCTMGVFHDASLVGGAVYHNWQPDEAVIELTAGSVEARWLTGPVIKAMFHAAFGMIGARLAVLRVSERNDRMRRIAKRFGFQETIIPRLRGEHEAECVYTLSAADWVAHKMNR